MNIRESSLLNKIETPVDCRYLTLACEFAGLTSEQIIDFSENIFQKINCLLSRQFVCSWRLNSHSVNVRSFTNRIVSLLSNDMGILLSFMAAAKSEQLVNIRDMNSLLNNLQRSVGGTRGLYVNVSIDFPCFWDHLFTDEIPSSNDLKKNIFRIFHAKNKKNVSYCTTPDCMGKFIATPDKKNSTLFSGSLCIQFGAHCFIDEILNMSNLFISWLESFSYKYLNLNGRVMLQPVGNWKGASPSMRYFGNNPYFDGSGADASLDERSWYSIYYLYGVEWFNLLSPVAVTHLHDIPCCTHTGNVCMRMLDNGSKIVASNNFLTDYDVEDAMELKLLLQPILYPGGSNMPIKTLFQPRNQWTSMRNHPRSDWAIVPIKEEEIDIIGTELVYRNR